MKTNLKFIALVLCIGIVACNRSDKNITIAGKGGNASIHIIPKHHDISKNIINAKVFIKYNTQNAPSSFDDSVVCENLSGVPTATFNGLKKGDYYIASIGYDTSIKQNVKGGIPYQIKEEAELTITVPVTESHE